MGPSAARDGTDAHAAALDDVVADDRAAARGARDAKRRAGDRVAFGQNIGRRIELHAIREARERVVTQRDVVVAVAGAFDALRVWRAVAPITQIVQRVVLIGRERGTARAFESVTRFVDHVVFDQVENAESGCGAAARIAGIACHSDSCRSRRVVDHVVMDVIVVGAKQHDPGAHVANFETRDLDVARVDDGQRCAIEIACVDAESAARPGTGLLVVSIDEVGAVDDDVGRIALTSLPL